MKLKLAALAVVLAASAAVRAQQPSDDSAAMVRLSDMLVNAMELQAAESMSSYSAIERAEASMRTAQHFASCGDSTGRTAGPGVWANADRFSVVCFAPNTELDDMVIGAQLMARASADFRIQADASKPSGYSLVDAVSGRAVTDSLMASAMGNASMVLWARYHQAGAACQVARDPAGNALEEEPAECRR